MHLKHDFIEGFSAEDTDSRFLVPPMSIARRRSDWPQYLLCQLHAYKTLPSTWPEIQRRKLNNCKFKVQFHQFLFNSAYVSILRRERSKISNKFASFRRRSHIQVERKRQKRRKRFQEEFQKFWRKLVWKCKLFSVCDAFFPPSRSWHLLITHITLFVES